LISMFQFIRIVFSTDFVLTSNDLCVSPDLGFPFRVATWNGLEGTCLFESSSRYVNPVGPPLFLYTIVLALMYFW
jgi:hypothetical protein